MAKYEVRLMFEWRGPCLWGMNDAAKDKYGYNELESLLPLSFKTKDKLAQLSKLHDGALDWENPAGPSPWVKEDFDQFETEAQSILRAIQIELGDSYLVWYDPLGEA